MNSPERENSSPQYAALDLPQWILANYDNSAPRNIDKDILLYALGITFYTKDGKVDVLPISVGSDDRKVYAIVLSSLKKFYIVFNKEQKMHLLASYNISSSWPNFVKYILHNKDHFQRALIDYCDIFEGEQSSPAIIGPGNIKTTSELINTMKKWHAVADSWLDKSFNKSYIVEIITIAIQYGLFTDSLKIEFSNEANNHRLWSNHPTHYEKSLQVSFNYKNEDQFRWGSLASAFKSDKCPRTLLIAITNSRLNNTDLMLILSGLHPAVPLEEFALNLSGNPHITKEAYRELALVMDKCIHLRRLSLCLDRNVLTDVIPYFAKAMNSEHCPQKITLSLKGTGISDNNIAALAGSIPQTKTKHLVLDLSDNSGITDEGCKLLAGALLKKYNPKVLEITLYNTGITKGGVIRIIDALRHSSNPNKNKQICFNVYFNLDDSEPESEDEQNTQDARDHLQDLMGKGQLLKDTWFCIDNIGWDETSAYFYDLNNNIHILKDEIKKIFRLCFQANRRASKGVFPFIFGMSENILLKIAMYSANINVDSTIYNDSDRTIDEATECMKEAVKPYIRRCLNIYSAIVLYNASKMPLEIVFNIIKFFATPSNNEAISEKETAAKEKKELESMIACIETFWPGRATSNREEHAEANKNKRVKKHSQEDSLTLRPH